jgi:hypothetical protein
VPYPRPRCRYRKGYCALSPQAAAWIISSSAHVLIEFPAQVFFRTDVVVVVSVRREELSLASRAPRHSWDLVAVLQDDEAAFHGRFIRLKQTRVGTLQYAPLVRHTKRLGRQYRCTHKMYAQSPA